MLVGLWNKKLKATESLHKKLVPRPDLYWSFWMRLIWSIMVLMPILYALLYAHPYRASHFFRFLYGDQARFFTDEIHLDLKHSKMGTIAMASAGENLNASQVVMVPTYF